MHTVIKILMVSLSIAQVQAAYTFKRSMTIDHTKVSTNDQTDFPVLVANTYTYLKTTGNGGKVQNSSGFDVGFFTNIDCSTGKLKWETDFYAATTGVVAYWVKIASLSHTVDTTFYMCYGDSSITTDQSDKNNVWNTGYKGVWHLPDGSSLTAVDSTSTGANGTVLNATATATGVIDGAASFNGTNALINLGNSISLLNPLTVEFWSLATSSGTVSLYALSKGYDGTNTQWTLGSDASNGTKMEFDVLANGDHGGVKSLTSISTSVYQHWAVTYDGTTYKIYLNGALDNSNTGVAPIGTSNKMEIGAVDVIGLFDTAFWPGKIDEVRASNVARPVDWLLTSYNSMSSPTTFYTVGSEQGGSGSSIQLLPILVNAPMIYSIQVSVGVAVRYNDQYNGSGGLPNNGRYSEGDSGRITWAPDGKNYYTLNDSNGPLNVLAATSGRNISFYTLSTDLLLQTLVNSLDDYGTMSQTNTNGWTDGGSWKSGGIASIAGKMWLWLYRLAFDGSVFSGNNSSLAWTTDNGATWCNFNHTDSNGNCTITPSSSGDAPTGDQAMFAPATDLSQIFFVSYCQDGSIACLTRAVDRNDEFLYVWAMNAAITKSKLLRISKTAKYHIAANYQYYKGGDGLLDTNWSSTSSDAVTLIDVGTIISGGVDVPLYVPQFDRWLATAWDNNNNTFFYQSKHLWGPWTKIKSLGIPANLPNFWNPVLSTLSAGSTSTTINYITSGSYTQRTGDPTTNNYSEYINTLTISLQ